MTIRAVSYGGGVQSTSLLVLAAQGRIDFPLFLMANVGDDSENPDTLEYVHDHAMPYAAAHGIEMAVLRFRRRNGEVETLLERMMKPGSMSVEIPAYMGADSGPTNRSCTSTFKIGVVLKELIRRGATKDDPAVVGIGISLDEIERANARKVDPRERLVYPLIGVGEDTGLHMRRSDCARVIRDAGLPVPPKSSCYFCPFAKAGRWVELRRTRPDLFEKSAVLEDTLNDRRRARGKDPVFLTRGGIPLREAVDTGQDTLFADDECDSGWCFT